jgi:hypothetical protein
VKANSSYYSNRFDISSLKMLEFLSCWLSSTERRMRRKRILSNPSATSTVAKMILFLLTSFKLHDVIAKRDADSQIQGGIALATQQKDIFLPQYKHTGHRAQDEAAYPLIPFPQYAL